MSHKKKPHATQAKYIIFCCHGSDCSKHGARDTTRALREEIRAHGLKHEVTCIKTECTDQCKHGPIVIVCPGRAEVGRTEVGGEGGGAVWYQHVKAKDAARIVREHLQHDQPVADKRYGGHDLNHDLNGLTTLERDEQHDS